MTILGIWVRSWRLAVLFGLTLVLVAATAASALGWSGEITTATANPEWTHGTVAGSVTWNECEPNHCKWLAILKDQSNQVACSAESYALNEEPGYYRTLWSGGGGGTNGTVPFNFSGQLPLYGVYGQHVCLYVVYGAWYPDPVCVAQKQILEEASGKPVECPSEEHVRYRLLGARYFAVEQPAPVVTTPSTSPISTQSPPAETSPVTQPLSQLAAKPLTRAQKLTKALKACKKKRPRSKRAKCERTARQLYGPKKNHH